MFIEFAISGVTAIRDLLEGNISAEPSEDPSAESSSDEDKTEEAGDEREEPAGRGRRINEKDAEEDDLDFMHAVQDHNEDDDLHWEWVKDEDLTPKIFPESPLVAKNLAIEQPVDVYLEMLGSETIDLITFETNRVRVQQNQSTKAFTKDEVAQFLGILMYRSLVKLPDLYDYWNSEMKIIAVSGAMPRHRFMVRSIV